jgi:hypothetical protein
MEMIKDRDTAINAALAKWIGGDVVVTRKRFFETTEVVVTENPNGYSVYRAFLIGDDRAEVSADLQDVSAEKAMTFLLEHGSF